MRGCLYLRGSLLRKYEPQAWPPLQRALALDNSESLYTIA